jgi:putative ABC transport system permease protein
MAVEVSLRTMLRAMTSMRADAPSTVVIVLSLGLGLGLNTAVFSIADAVLLHPFPYVEPDRLVVIWGTTSRDIRRAVSGQMIDTWRRESHSLSAIAPFQLNLVSFALGDDASDTIHGCYVGGEIFETLGVSPTLGSAFGSHDEAAEHAEDIVLSDRLWQTRFGGDPHILGSRVRLNNRPYTVRAVMGREFFFPDRDVDLWVRLSRESSQFAQVHGLARLRGGTSLEAARAELEQIERSTRSPSHPETDRSQVGLFSIHSVIVGDYQASIWILVGAVSLVVLLACANVVHLLLGRGATRRRDYAIRKALGARRRDIFQQVLADSVVLSLIACAAGLIVGYVGIRVIQGWQMVSIPGFDHARINTRVLGASVGLAIICGLLTGLVPALQAWAGDVNYVLQRGGNEGKVGVAIQLRDLLICIEVALALVVVVNAGLLLHSFIRLTRADWGFRPANLMAVNAELPREMWLISTKGTAGPGAPQLFEFIEASLSRLRSLPSVEAVTVARSVPLQRTEWSYLPVAVNGQLLTGRWPLVEPVGPGYFHTLGVPLLAGREFTSQDTARGPSVIVVNQAFAENTWPGESPIGKHVSIVVLDDRRPDVADRIRRRDRTVPTDMSAYKEVGGGPVEIVGVVGNMRMMGLEREAEPTVFTGILQWPYGIGTGLIVAMRSSARAEIPVGDVMNILHGLSDRVRVRRMVTMEALIGDSVGGRGSNRLLVLTFTIFGTLSLCLAATGVYGIVSHLTVGRTREIGVRMALGAGNADIVRMLVRGNVRTVLWGVALGLTITIVTGRLIRHLLFAITPADPTTFAAAIVLVFTMSVIALLIPSFRILSTDPIAALRHE